MPHDKVTNIPVIGTVGGGGSRTTPLRLLGGLGSRASGFLGLGGGGGASATGTASSPLVGPELDYALPHDATGWMPFDATAQVFARVLFGTLEIGGESTPVQDYSAGLRLAIPVWRPPNFTLSPYVSAGPGYLKTDIGHATGVDAAVGLRAEYRVTKSVYLVAQIELDTFTSSDFSSWGPAGNLGFNFGF